MNYISIIGAGQLGSRHLQALASLDRKAKIYVIDPSEESLSIAKERYTEMPSNPNLEIVYSQSIEQIKNKLDLAIIATNSNVRKSVIHSLLEHIQVKYLILEKVLFQQEDTYSEIAKELENANVQVWVNCSRRMWDFYQWVIQNFDMKENLTMEVSGSNLGIASNTIHFLDLFSSFIKSENIKLDTSNLHNRYFESSRKGFIEFTGKIEGTSKSNRLIINSYDVKGSPVIVSVSSPEIQFDLNEESGEVSIYTKESNWEMESRTVDIPYQSQLTHLAVQSILDEERCKLPKYDVSSNLHLILLNAIMEFLSEIGYAHNGKCPIT